jgi:hypothetical protein
MGLRNRIAPLSGGALLLIVSALGVVTYTGSAEPSPSSLTGTKEVPAIDTTTSTTSRIAAGKDMSVTRNVETSGIEG